MGYEDDKSYFVKGSKLNQIDRDLATARIIKGDGIQIRRIPGTGTQIWVDLAGDLPPRQWQLRLTAEAETLVAQIRSGTLTGLGLGGYLEGHDPDEWINLPGTERQVWLKLTVSVAGTPYTYSISADATATVWLPSHVESAEAELHFTALGVDAPDPTSPAIDPENGMPATDGVYYFRIGYVNGPAGGAHNDYLGPLGLGWCPPDAPYLVSLT